MKITYEHNGRTVELDSTEAQLVLDAIKFSCNTLDRRRNSWWRILFCKDRYLTDLHDFYYCYSDIFNKINDARMGI